MAPFAKILVPTDFSPASDAALACAASLADTSSAAIVVLHVYESPRFAYPALSSSPLDDVSLVIEVNARIGVEAAVTRLAVNGRAVEGMVRQGSPWRRIEEVATEVGADLIVMGTHGRRGFARALIGSVAERIVRVSTIPVLTVHAPVLPPVLRSTMPTEPDLPSRDGACG